MIKRKIGNLGFCDSYGYPVAVKEHLAEILDQILYFLGANAVRSVILFGSTSRGELSYKISDDEQIDLLSDYEFLIVARERVSKSQTQALSKALRGNRVRWRISNPLFHIEFMLNSTLKFFVKTPFLRRIGAYELFKEGVTLFGDDLLNYQLGGDITADNLDYGNTNALILERLWWLLFYMPLSIISQQMTSSEEEIINYLTARSALEILAIFLPNEGMLLPGYRKRVDYFVRHYPEGSYFGPSFHGFISNCLDHKLYLCAHDSFVNNYRNLLEGYLSLLNYLLSEKKPHSLSIEALSPVCDRLVRTEKNLFPDPFYPSWRRLIKDYRVARALGICSPVSWMWTEKRLHAVAFLLYAHGALLEHLEGRAMPAHYLQRAASLLAWLTRNNQMKACQQVGKNEADKVDEWVRLCRRFVDFMITWRVAPRPQEGSKEEVLQKGDW